MGTSEKILEHKNKVAAVYFPDEVFGEKGLRYVQTEYRLEGGRPDLILLDANNRYLVVEIKAGLLSAKKWGEARSQLERYKRRISKDYGAEVSAQMFRFVYLSDQPPAADQVSELEAMGVEVRTIPKRIVGKEPLEKIVRNRAFEQELVRLDPPLVYSFDQGFQKWGTSEETQEVLEKTLEVLHKTVPEFHSEKEIQDKGTGLVPKTSRVNIVCPFFSWKRFGQLQLQSAGLRFMMNFRSIDNVFRNRRLGDKQLLLFNSLFDPVKWEGKKKARWSHSLRILGPQDLVQLKSGLMKARPEIKTIIGPEESL